MTTLDTSHAKKMRVAMIDYLTDLQSNRAISLCTNFSSGDFRQIPEQMYTNHAHQIMSFFEKKLNHTIAGPRWYKNPKNQLVGFAFLELAHVNPHWHAMVRAKPNQLEQLDNNVERIWKEICPPGSVDIQEIYDQKGIASYITKELRYNPSSFENFWIFGPKH